MIARKAAAPAHAHVWETGKTRGGANRKRCTVKRCRFHTWVSQPKARGRRGNHLAYLDKKVTGPALVRDKALCIASFFLLGTKVVAHDPHHIARKGTHRGAGVRVDAGYVIWLSREMHDKEHAGELKITAEEYQGRVLWILSMKVKLEDGTEQLRTAARVVDHDVVTVERKKSRVKKGTVSC